MLRAEDRMDKLKVRYGLHYGYVTVSNYCTIMGLVSRSLQVFIYSPARSSVVHCLHG